MSHSVSRAHHVRLTEMEVVVLCVAEGDQEANDVDERCAWLIWVLYAHVASSEKRASLFATYHRARLTPS